MSCRDSAWFSPTPETSLQQTNCKIFSNHSSALRRLALSDGKIISQQALASGRLPKGSLDSGTRARVRSFNASLHPPKKSRIFFVLRVGRLVLNAKEHCIFVRPSVAQRFTAERRLGFLEKSPVEVEGLTLEHLCDAACRRRIAWQITGVHRDTSSGESLHVRHLGAFIYTRLVSDLLLQNSE
jgi:hypothetical protein